MSERRAPRPDERRAPRPDERRAPRSDERRSPRVSLRVRLLAFNALLVFLPVAGVLFLDTYERQLLADQERAMVEQGRVLAAALSERGPLDAEDVRHTLVQLRQRTGARIRVVDTEGNVLADTSLLGPRREPDAAAPEPEEQGILYRLGALPFRAYRRLLGAPERPHGSADVYAAGRPVLGREVRTALAGGYGAATRISSGGQRSVTLYSALPIVDGSPVGAVVVSQSTYRILRALYRVRVDVLRVFLASLAAAVVLSLLVSHTIARPLVALRNQAEALLDRGRLRGRFDTPARRDEIGDLARSLEGLRERLEEHIADVEAFASDVSHEFKNPLASIRTASELLVEVEAPAERKRFAEVVEREVARMEQMLSAVREISHLDAGAPAEDRGPVDLRELVDGVAEAHRLRGGTALAVRGPATLPVIASPDRVTRIVENLVDNAAGFAPAETPIEIELEADPAGARLRVLDRGPGVPDAHVERIFDRFFTWRPGAGGPGGHKAHVGLGLPIARALAEADGGSLEVRSRPDGGACFELRLAAPAA